MRLGIENRRQTLSAARECASQPVRYRASRAILTVGLAAILAGMDVTGLGLVRYPYRT